MGSVDGGEARREFRRLRREQALVQDAAREQRWAGVTDDLVRAQLDDAAQRLRARIAWSQWQAASITSRRRARRALRRLEREAQHALCGGRGLRTAYIERWRDRGDQLVSAANTAASPTAPGP